MPPPSSPMLQLVIDYIWVPIVLWISALTTRSWGHHTRQSLMEQRQEQFQRELDQHRQAYIRHREEDRALHRAQRDELMERINSHHKTAMTKLEAIEARLNDFLTVQYKDR